MTFLLPAEPRRRAERPAERPTAGFGEVFSAARDRADLTADHSGRARKDEDAIFDAIDRRLGARSPVRGPLPRAAERPEGMPAPIADPLTQARLRERRGFWSEDARRALLAAAGEAATRDPGSWGDLPLTEEALRERVNVQLRRDYEEAQSVLGMGGDYAWLAEFGGEIVADMTSPAGIAAGAAGAITGGGATFGRLLLTEAGLGAAFEAATLPGQFEMAERLDIDDPNAAAQIAFGAAGGAAFAAGFELVGRAVRRGAAYARGRGEQLADTRPDAASPADHQTRVGKAERALQGGDALRPPPPVETDREFASVARRIVQVESGGRADARNPESTATGAGQFIDATWIDMIQRHRPDIAANRSRKEVLALRGDAELSLEMTEAYARDNAEALRAAGFQPTEADVYLAHFLGPGGARDALLADLDAPVSTVMSETQIAANGPKRQADGSWAGGLTYAGRPLQHWTVRDLRRWSEVKMGQAKDPGPGYRPATSRGFTSAGEVTTSAGTRVAVEYEVVDLDALIFATGDRQPRDRGRAAPTALVADRAARLDPALLMPSPLASTGAPIVGPDGVIDSGNGRVMSIRHAAEAFPDRYAAYVDAIRAGFEIPEGVARPVLIARRTDELAPEELQRFVREANVDAVERLSPTEQARVDADALSPRILGLYDPEAGGVDAAGNRPFAAQALGAVPAAERGALVDRRGALTAAGAERLRGALFARAFDAPDLVALRTEAEGGAVKGLLDAMTEAAPVWARLRDDVAEGRLRPEFDVTADLAQAVRLIAEARARARTQGQTVRAALDDLLAQEDLLGGGASALTARFARLAYDRRGLARSADDVAGALADYAAEARRVGAAEGGLLDAVAPVTPLDALDAAARRLEDATEAPAGPPARGAAAEGADELGLFPPDVRGVDDAGWAGGAEAPAAQAADAQAEAELRAQLGADVAPPRRTDDAPATQGGSDRNAPIDDPAPSGRSRPVAENAGGVGSRGGAGSPVLATPGARPAREGGDAPRDPELSEARAAVEAGGDFEIKMPGGDAFMASDLLRSIDDDLDFVETLAVCRPGGARG